jgi:adenosylcobinamide amidohydrolase
VGASANNATNYYGLSGVAYNTVTHVNKNVDFTSSKDTKLFTTAGQNNTLRPVGGGGFSSQYSSFTLYLVPVGNPGAINISASIGYRLIG